MKNDKEPFFFLFCILIASAGVFLHWLVRQLILFFSIYGPFIVQTIVVIIAILLVIGATIFLIRRYNAHLDQKEYRQSVYFQIDQNEEATRVELVWVSDLLFLVDSEMLEIQRQFEKICKPSQQVVDVVEKKLMSLFRQKGELQKVREDLLDHQDRLQDKRNEIKLMQYLNKDSITSTLDQELCNIQQASQAIAYELKYELQAYQSNLLREIESKERIAVSDRPLLIEEELI